MKQVVQSYRTGALAVEDVPSPALRPRGLLVRTVASAVSTGTEKSKVELARQSLVGKAMARPDQVKKVLDTLKTEGLVATYNKVRSKLDRLSPLGYSASGRVVAVGEGCEGFTVGDAVACGGADHAHHAELLWVPANLCARIPDGVAFEEAAFATIGSIALHGVRRAEVQLGETVVVIGLGLIGQLTAQLLRASGCRVVGIDIDPWKVELARQHGVELALLRSDDVIGRTHRLAEGRGADAVIITAAAGDNDPVVLAGELARDRAHVVIVGAVPLEIPRSPYYEKELDVRVSRSYGPGRYDRGYEERGLDYPIGYVRWTENRNMQAFLRALETKQVSLAHLISHRVALADAERAYDLVTGAEPVLGVVLQYPEDVTLPRWIPTPGHVSTPHVKRATVSLGLIGAGSFACGTLLPILARMPRVALAKVCTASGLTARDAAIRHRFAAAVGAPEDVLGDDAIDAVVIATRHDSHAALAAAALRGGKAVFVEKPLALDRAQLADVLEAAAANPRLTVGFNRRFSPHTARVRDALAGAGALVIHMRVNAGPIAADSWIHDAETGGRLLGEVCHFIDLAQALAGARVRRVFATGIGLPDPASRLRDNLCVSVELTDGSVASIAYTSQGDAALGKERIEVFGGGVSAVIDDFRITTVMRGRRRHKLETKQDKGHRDELARFIAMVTAGAPPPISLAEVRSASLGAIAALEALAIGMPVEVQA